MPHRLHKKHFIWNLYKYVDLKKIKRKIQSFVSLKKECSFICKTNWIRIIQGCSVPSVVKILALSIWRRRDCLVILIPLKQEVHGPHRSPEKTVQINNTYDYIITLIKRRIKNTLLSSWEFIGSLFEETWNPFT